VDSQWLLTGGHNTSNKYLTDAGFSFQDIIVLLKVSFEDSTAALLATLWEKSHGILVLADCPAHLNGDEGGDRKSIKKTHKKTESTSEASANKSVEGLEEGLRSKDFNSKSRIHHLLSSKNHLNVHMEIIELNHQGGYLQFQGGLATGEFKGGLATGEFKNLQA
jgi:hypothetical protein